MKFPTKYKCLDINNFNLNNYSISPIRYEDRKCIMKWRNEQLFHLRQKEKLTSKIQDSYFKETILNSYHKKNPKQILFSYLDDGELIGYGGLVHIDWINLNAEISFIMNTSLEKNYFNIHWSNFLKLLEMPAFGVLGFNKIYTYAFDLRSHLYDCLESNNYILEARLKKHFRFENNFIDVVIHSKISPFSLRCANKNDCSTLFKWVNEKSVRKNSLNSKEISLTEHKDWYKRKMRDPNVKIYILTYNDIDVAQIRFENINDEQLIDFSVDSKYRGQGLGTIIMSLGMRILNSKNYIGYVKNNNISSAKVFKSIGFKIISEENNVIKFFKN